MKVKIEEFSTELPQYNRRPGKWNTTVQEKFSSNGFCYSQ